MDTAAITAQAQSVGLSPADISTILSTDGPAILQVVIDLIQNGLSPATLMEIWTKLGPVILTLVGEIINANKQVTVQTGVVMASPTRMALPPQGSVDWQPIISVVLQAILALLKKK